MTAKTNPRLPEKSQAQPSAEGVAQHQRFIETARELGCEDDEEASLQPELIPVIQRK